MTQWNSYRDFFAVLLCSDLDEEYKKRKHEKQKS